MKKIKIYKNQGFYRVNIPKVMADIHNLDKEEYLEIECTSNGFVIKKIQKKIQKNVDK